MHVTLQSPLIGNQDNNPAPKKNRFKVTSDKYLKKIYIKSKKSFIIYYSCMKTIKEARKPFCQLLKLHKINWATKENFLFSKTCIN